MAKRRPKLTNDDTHKLALAQLNEVANIAETILRDLLCDDEEHFRDMLADDYMLDSNLETFENLTGKKIRPSTPKG